MKMRAVAFQFLVLSWGSLVHAQEVFTVDVPGATFTRVLGLNAQGDVCGGILLGGARLAFTGSRRADFTDLETFAYPGAVFTQCRGINAPGRMVGVYQTADTKSHASGITPQGDITGIDTSTDGRFHGYILTADGFQTIDVPGAVTTGSPTGGVFIAASGELAGGPGSIASATTRRALFPGPESVLDSLLYLAGVHRRTPYLRPVLAGFVDVGVMRAHRTCAMPHHLTKLTPNLVVADVSRSIAFYRDVLGFTVQTTVPDAAPFVFAIVQSGTVEIFLNEANTATAEYPAFKGRPIGGTLTLFIQVDDVRAAHEALKSRVEIVMPLETKWYGATEFAFLDPDGYVITFAQQETGA